MGWTRSAPVLQSAQGGARRPKLTGLELAYLAVVAQTTLCNPVVATVGTLRVYANGISWAALAVAGVVRWTTSRDPVLQGAFRSLALVSWVSITAIVAQLLVLGTGSYTAGSFVRLLYVPMGLVAAFAIYRRIDEVLDLVVGLVGLECVVLLLGVLRNPIDLANRLNPASLGGRNTFAAFLMAVIVLRASIWSYTRERPPLYVLAAMAVALVAMVLTLTRSPVIGLVIGLLTISVAALRRQGHLTGRSLRWGLLGGLVLSPVLAQRATRERFSSLSLSQSSGRDDIWDAASQRFTESPFVGHGFGSFDFTSPNIVEDFVTADKFGPAAPGVAHHTSSAHNLVWQVLAEGGVIGLAVVGWCIWYLSRHCWHAILLPVLLALFVDSMFQTIPYVVQTSWVLGLVFATGLHFRHRPGGAAPAAGQRVADTR